MQHTCLYQNHLDQKARMVSFAGWEMPVQYAGVVSEVKAVRTSCGLFDASHMGEIEVWGTGARDWLDRLTTNALAPVQKDQARYTLLLNAGGGVIDDLILYHLEDKEIKNGATDHWLVVCNASNHDPVLAHLQVHLPKDGTVTLQDRSDEIALIAVQGPQARLIAGALFAADKDSFPRRFRWQKLPSEWSVPETAAVTFVARTGYTGEDGIELFVDCGRAPALWEALVAGGAVPCGLGARDVCRIEAGLPLYGHEMNLEVGPRTANLMFAVALDKGEFTGRSALLTEDGSHTIGIIMVERAVPREGYPVLYQGRTVGEVSSGTFSPVLEAGIAMVRMRQSVPEDAELEVEIRNRTWPARCRGLPFIHQFRKSVQ